MFLSRDSWPDLGSIRKSALRSYGTVAGGRASDTAVVKPGIRPRIHSGELAECGSPLRKLAPEPPKMPVAAREENRELLKKFLVDS